MANPERLLACAAHLLAAAINARESGQVEFANWLVMTAADYLDRAVPVPEPQLGIEKE